MHDVGPLWNRVCLVHQPAWIPFNPKHPICKYFNRISPSALRRRNLVLKKNGSSFLLYRSTQKMTTEATAQTDVPKFRRVVSFPMGPSIKEIFLISFTISLYLFHGLLFICSLSILKPIWTYGLQLWGSASNSNIEILERFQSKVLRTKRDARWHVPYVTYRCCRLDKKCETTVSPTGIGLRITPTA